MASPKSSDSKGGELIEERHNPIRSNQLNNQDEYGGGNPAIQPIRAKLFEESENASQQWNPPKLRTPQQSDKDYWRKREHHFRIGLTLRRN
jgi:hypothetical protein